MKKRLIEKGVKLLDPDSVYIAEGVDPDRIHPNAVIHPGCRLSGSELSIGPDCVIGGESPVTLRNVQLGRGVVVAGGFLDGTTMLDGASAGDGFHSRPGTLMEECSRVGHTVGLKQTILMPYVALGSLINFCDVLMAGGTGSDNHSEVGSSYIHFNFTAHQDKATASLLGDVPRGVLLDQAPIFLGGQGGLVGPRRIAFGTVVAAGSILRSHVLEPNLLVTGSVDVSGLRRRAYKPGCYGRVDDVLETCRLYLGNVLALRAWYAYVRAPFMARTPWGAACLAGGQKRLAEVWNERIQRLDELAKKLETSVAAAGDRAGSLVFAGQRGFVERWLAERDALEAISKRAFEPEKRAATVIARLIGASGESFVASVQQLSGEDKVALTDWLDGVVAPVTVLGRL